MIFVKSLEFLPTLKLIKDLLTQAKLALTIATIKQFQRFLILAIDVRNFIIVIKSIQ